MYLNRNDDERHESPDAETIRSVIELLPVDEFAILTKADEVYVQTYHEEDGTWALEYRDGSFDKHFSAAGEINDAGVIVDVFVAYAFSPETWKEGREWEKVEFDEDFEGDLVFDNSYELNGEEFRKIPIGKERSSIVNAQGQCPECAQAVGEFHTRGCAREECPRCHERLMGCACE